MEVYILFAVASCILLAGYFLGTIYKKSKRKAKDDFYKSMVSGLNNENKDLSEKLEFTTGNYNYVKKEATKWEKEYVELAELYTNQNKELLDLKFSHKQLKNKQNEKTTVKSVSANKPIGKRTKPVQKTTKAK